MEVLLTQGRYQQHTWPAGAAPRASRPRMWHVSVRPGRSGVCINRICGLGCSGVCCLGVRLASLCAPFRAFFALFLASRTALQARSYMSSSRMNNRQKLRQVCNLAWFFDSLCGARCLSAKHRAANRLRLAVLVFTAGILFHRCR